MAESGTPPAPEEANESGRAGAPERGVQLDVDKMIETLLSYKSNPGKQVGMCCELASLCSCSFFCFRAPSPRPAECAERGQGFQGYSCVLSDAFAGTWLLHYNRIGHAFGNVLLLCSIANSVVVSCICLLRFRFSSLRSKYDNSVFVHVRCFLSSPCYQSWTHQLPSAETFMANTMIY